MYVCMDINVKDPTAIFNTLEMNFGNQEPNVILVTNVPGKDVDLVTLMTLISLKP